LTPGCRPRLWYAQGSLAGLDFTQLILSFLVLIGSLTFHEAAHAWTADRLGDPTARLLGRLSLNPAVHIDVVGTIVFPLIALMTGVPLIGWAKPVPVDMRNLKEPRRDFAIVALAGPVSNLLLAVVGAVIVNLMPSDEVQIGLAQEALIRFVLINVLLAVFNMIPIPPLDGGNVLIGVLPAQLAEGVERTRSWGFLLLYVLMLSGMLSAITFPVQRAILNWLL
jgi:Zn-dependent protease